MNNKGDTLIFVMMLLIVFGFIGTSLIKMSTSDQVSSIFYNSSDNARIIIPSAYNFGKYKIETPKDSSFFDSLLSYLSSYLNTSVPETLYLAGNAGSSMNMGNNQQFNIALTGFDVNNMCVRVDIHTIGKGNARANAYAVYQLHNLEIHTDTFKTNIPDSNHVQMSAFKLSGNSDFESNCDVQADGMVYIKGKFTVNSSTFKFNGPFYQENGNHKSVINGGSLIFNDKTYLGGHWEFGSAPYFGKAVGFEGGIIGHNNSPTFKGPIWHNGRKTTNWTNAALALHSIF
jgi:hypothetical protein